MIEAYSYHTSSRFGSRVKLFVEDEWISVTGPRMNFGLFRIWLSIQGILLVLLIFFLLKGVIFLNPIYLLFSFGFFLLHMWGCMGGTAVWELFNLFGHATAKFHVKDIKNFQRGKGWARGFTKLLIPFYVFTMNRISPGLIISFEAPDEISEKNVIYALMLWKESDLKILENTLLV